MNEFIPMEVRGFPGFYYAELADNLAVNLNGDVLYLASSRIKRNDDKYRDLNRSVDTVYRGIRKRRAIKTILYCAMFSRPTSGRITGAFIQKDSILLRSQPAPSVHRLAADLLQSGATYTLRTMKEYIYDCIPINGMTYIDLFDLPADKRKALLEDWVAFKQGKVTK